jgi:alpha-N-arabinofuranosidase
MPDFSSSTEETVLAVREYSSPEVVIKISADLQEFNFYIGENEDRLSALYLSADGRLINPEVIGGMVGTMLGMFASSNGTESRNSACFDWFTYSGQDL